MRASATKILRDTRVVRSVRASTAEIRRHQPVIIRRWRSLPAQVVRYPRVVGEGGAVSHEVGLLLLPWMHLAVVREAKTVPRRGNVSMGGRRRRRGVVVVVERSSERLLKLGVERRGGRGVPRPVPMLHDLGRANPPNPLLPASIDIRCVCCCCCGCRRHGWLSRPSRGANGALSERLGLFGGGIMRSFRVGFERFPERLGLLRRGLGAGSAVWLRQGTRGAAHGSKVVGQDFDKVGWEEADGPPISAQPARPPGPVAGVETFDQVALDKAKIAFGLFARQQG